MRECDAGPTVSRAASRICGEKLGRTKMIAVGNDGARKQLLRQFIRVANTEIETLSRDRMQRLRCVTEKNGALAGDAGREFKRQREGAPVGNTNPWPGAGSETLGEGGQERLFRKRDQRARIFRSCRPHQAIMILFGQERHRTFVGKALERESTVRLNGPDPRDKRGLSVVVPASRDVVDDPNVLPGPRIAERAVDDRRRRMDERDERPFSARSRLLVDYLDNLPRIYAVVWIGTLAWAADYTARSDLSAGTMAGLIVSVGIGSAVALPTAHELLHRRSGFDERLARLMTALCCYGHMVVEHFHHHATVGEPEYGATARRGMAVVSPNAEERTWIHDRYVGQLLKGDFREETRYGVISVVKRLREEENIDGVILGGTELTLLLSAPVVEDIPALDTTELHVDAIVKRLQA